MSNGAIAATQPVLLGAAVRDLEFELNIVERVESLVMNGIASIGLSND
jgi:hypothetical protein